MQTTAQAATLAPLATQCTVCDNTRWTSRGLCRSCEYLAKPSCYAQYDSTPEALNALDEIQRRALAARPIQGLA